MQSVAPKKTKPCVFQININNTAGLKTEPLTLLKYALQSIFIEAGTDVRFDTSEGVTSQSGPYTLNIVNKYPGVLPGFGGSPDVVITEKVQREALGITLVSVDSQGRTKVDNKGFISRGALKNQFKKGEQLIGLARSGAHEAGRFFLQFPTNAILGTPGIMGPARDDYLDPAASANYLFTPEQAKALQAHCR